MAKLQKSLKSGPTWREKLAEYDINNIYDGRKCEIILMAELTILFSEAIVLFHVGAKDNPTNVVKSISCESFIQDITKAKHAGEGILKPEKSKSKSDPTAALFQSATAEAVQFLNSNQSIPLELMAQLLKLKVINMINEDVILRDAERILEIEKLANKEPDKKGKGEKEKNAKKGTGKLAAIKLPVEKRQLYFLISGFYEPHLIQELCSIEVPLSAIIELSSPECIIFKEKYTARGETPRTSIPTSYDSIISNNGSEAEEDDEVVLYVNQHYCGSKESVSISMFGGEPSTSSITTSIYEKTAALNNFWDNIYEELEGELQAQCLENTIHIRINPLSATQVDKNPQQVFLEIRNEMLKIPDVKRQHLNYLHNVKIYEIKLEPKDIPITAWKTYRKLMDMVPSECFTTELFLHCLVEEVCSRVPDPKPRRSMKANLTPIRDSECHKESKQIQEPFNFSSVNVKTSRKGNALTESNNKLEENGKPLKELAHYVIQYRKNYSPLARCGITYRQNKFNLKTNLKISKKPFIMHETSLLEYKLNSYPELSKRLLKINIDILKKSPAALLWNNYSQFKTIEVIYKNHQLETWRRLLHLSIDEIQYALAAIQLNLLPCLASSKNAVEVKNSLQILFPGKNESKILKTAMPKIKYIQTPDISLRTLNERLSYLEIPEVPYSDIPNIYEAKNVPTYLWYEKLSREVMLQQLQKANFDYVCVDHKYCPYNDAIILRYHNNVDMFGINSKIWSESLRTPVCFRDFCKYVIHDEAQWLEKEEDTYQNKLRACKENPNSTEEITPDPIQCQKPSIKKLSTECAKAGEPYSFLAYDLSEARIQLTGATTIFHSLDGYKITVDRTSFIGKPNNLSLNVEVAGHNFILHYNKATLTEPFMFHYILSDGTIIVFDKPAKSNKPEISVAEKSKILKPKCKKDGKSVYQRREKNYYYVTEIKRCYLKSSNVPSVARQSLLLDEDFKLEYLKQLKTNSAKSSKKKINKFRRSTSSNYYVENPNTLKDSEKFPTLYGSPSIQTSSSKTNDLKPDLRTLGALKAQAECNKVLKKIEEAKKIQIPMFKVYSSKLHKFEYIKRIKSHIHVKIGKHTISLLCKHPMVKTTRDVEVVKVFPVKLTDSIFYNNNCYDIKISLPSGLLIHTLPGINKQPFNIKQKYIEMNPYCNNIVNEDSRTFMRNGHVVVKKSDGTLDIFSASGQIIHCEIPHSTAQTHTKYRVKTRPNNIQDEKTKLTKLESKLHRIVNWRRRHIIAGTESRYFKYRRINLRKHKLQAKNSKEIYVMQKGFNPSIEFTLITHDGKQLKVTNTHVKHQNNVFQTTFKDEYYDGDINVRDDGTINFIYGGGIFTTQFSDKTKISSWFVEAPELIMFEDEDSLFGMDSMSSLLYEQTMDSEWVFVQLFYKFEHPNYATILYSSDNYETEINLPNDITMNVTENGHYFLDINGAVSSVINDGLVYLESKSCDTCMQRSITVVNIKPLYDGIYPIDENTELLKTCDSYEKVFLVNYNGKCFRNSNYVRYRKNRAECHQHDKKDHQQLYILNRDLSGSKFWDVKTYRQRVIEATDNSNTVLQYYGKNAKSDDYTSLEMRTYKYTPYHMRFINQHVLNDLILSTCQNEPNPPLPAYTTVCHIHIMPKQCMTKLLETSMMGNSEIEAEFPKSDNKTTPCKCVSQIGRENVKLKKQSVFDEHLRHVSSALLLLKKWYSWHELNKPYVPPNVYQICKCEPDARQETPEAIQPKKISADSFNETQKSSLEIVTDRTNLGSVIGSYKKLHKTICKCNIPESIVCECNNFEAKQSILSTKVDFLDDFWFVAEESMAASDVQGASASDTVIQEKPVAQPPCKCNIEKKLHQRPLAPKHRLKRTCTEDTCNKQKHQMSSNKDHFNGSNTTLYNENHKRQAGGAELPPYFSDMKKYSIQKRNLLKELQRKIVEIVLAASATGEVSTEKAEHYKIAVIIDIISNISRAQLNTSELRNLLKRLNDVDMNKYRTVPAEQLSRLILSLYESRTKDIVRKSFLHWNSTSKLITQQKYQANITKSTIRTTKTMKHEHDLDELKPINKKQIRDNTKINKINVNKIETFTKNVPTLFSTHKNI